MRRHEVQGIAIPAMDISKLGVADADGILQYGCKHRLKIAGRAADNLEHLRRGSLLLQRLGEVGGPLAQFVEQPRILDGDDSLGSEIRNEEYLFVSKGTDFLAKQSEYTDQVIFPQHWHKQTGSYPGLFDR